MSAVKTYIVEDSPVILHSLVAALEELATVEVLGSAGDESTALEHLEMLGARVDLLIVDVFLKRGTGLGVLRGADDAGVRGKRVVLTNYATPAMRAKCKALGADRVFDKSTDLDALVDYCCRLGNGFFDSVPGEVS